MQLSKNGDELNFQQRQLTDCDARKISEYGKRPIRYKKVTSAIDGQSIRASMTYRERSRFEIQILPEKVSNIKIMFRIRTKDIERVNKNNNLSNF